jgi:hypothetical protein
MKICVCGWYFDDNLYASLWRINQKHPVFIVAHKDSEMLKSCDLPYEVIENTGLEWGAYNHYIKNVWDGDAVLFMHDDIRIKPVVVDYVISPGESVFNVLAKIEHDQAYVFQDRREDVLNYGQHGRMVFLSERLVTLLHPYGLPSDTKNEYHYNHGTNAAYAAFIEIQRKRPGWALLKKVYAPNLDFGYRGKFGDPKKVFQIGLEQRI